MLKLDAGVEASGLAIPSQPAISRLENVADARSLYRIGIGFIDLFCRGFAKSPASIVLDIDDTDDPVHGQQELALFNTHAGGHCFQPIHIFEALGQADPVAAAPRQAARRRGERANSTFRCGSWFCANRGRSPCGPDTTVPGRSPSGT